MTQSRSAQYYFRLWTVLFILYYYGNCNHVTTAEDDEAMVFTKSICMQTNSNNVLRARQKTCFLRPDTGPCRADIVQWYYDVKQKKCYRFFWGGCQGNGNKFETKSDCYSHCNLSPGHAPIKVPYYCSLSFDFGSCFGYFPRWAWDYMSKTCRRKIYSGCGGNQNNFETREECWQTCLIGPNNTIMNEQKYTTCIPFDIPEEN